MFHLYSAGIRLGHVNTLLSAVILPFFNTYYLLLIHLWSTIFIYKKTPIQVKAINLHTIETSVKPL